MDRENERNDIGRNECTEKPDSNKCRKLHIILGYFGICTTEIPTEYNYNYLPKNCFVVIIPLMRVYLFAKCPNDPNMCVCVWMKIWMCCPLALSPMIQNSANGSTIANIEVLYCHPFWPNTGITNTSFKMNSSTHCSTNIFNYTEDFKLRKKKLNSWWDMFIAFKLLQLFQSTL